MAIDIFHKKNKYSIAKIKSNLIEKTGIIFKDSLIMEVMQNNPNENPEDILYKKYLDTYMSSINILDGEKISDKDISKYKKSKVLVLSIVKNCVGSYQYIKTFIEQLQQKTDKTCFYYLTNNNIDRTIQVLKKWSDNNKNIAGKNIENEQIITVFNNGIIGNRINKFAEYRTQCLLGAIDHFGEDFDYLIVFDSDLYDFIPTDKIFESMNIEKKWSVISGNMTYKKSSCHYDQLALRAIDEDDNISTLYPNFTKFYGRSQQWLNKIYIINNMVEVKSAFGGISIYNFKEIVDLLKVDNFPYDVSQYPEGTCEHIALSNKLPNKKFVSGDISYQNNTSIEGSLVSNPKIFIPRDAGFFSVFNFYVGSLTRGSRIYPLFNKEAFMKLHKQNAHFSYWTDKFNCWFDYFEPVSFYDNDNTHSSIDSITKIRGLEITVGEIAPKEFTHPASSEALLNDRENFSKWRHYVHGIYSRYIKFDQAIMNDANSFWTENIGTNKAIGVHYRHPSHSCESGNIYLKQYFEEIDNILQKEPESNIFLASDNMLGILAFKDRYGDKIKYIQDIDRLDMDNLLSWAYELAKGKKADVVGMINGKGFELQHIAAANNTGSKKMTTDLFKEVICLSKCNHLIHTVSNIPLAISYMNPNLQMITIRGIKC
jgi:hypothetical protein